MNRSIRVLKKYAKNALNGRMAIAFFSLMAVSGINTLASYFVSGLFKGDSVLSIVLYEVTLFITFLILNLFVAGLNFLYLNIARDREYSLGDLFYFFKHQPDRVIIAGLILTILEIIASLPYNYAWYTMEPGTTLDSQMNYMITILALMLFTTVVNTLLSIPFSQVYYLQADDEELGGIEALKQSWRLMKGKKMKMFLLELSFIPLIILSAFTLYLALIWILPYRDMALAEFYRDLRGEFDQQELVYQEPTDYHALMENTDIESHYEDDFHSEA